MNTNESPETGSDHCLSAGESNRLLRTLEDANSLGVPDHCVEPEFRLRASELAEHLHHEREYGSKRQAVRLLVELGHCLRAELNWWDGGRGHEVAAAIYQRVIFEAGPPLGLRW